MAETRVLAKLFEEWGFDALHVSGGVYGDFNKGIVSPMYVSHAWLANAAEEVKKIVKIPVITVNRINDPRMADQLIEMGKADFVGMGRGSLADPALPNKAKAGKIQDIRFCIGCLQGCTGALYVGGPVTCLVNPSVGREYEIDYTRVKEPKKIAVIGGGPGGMTTAITAARRGHNVTLFEAKDKTGGQFVSAAYPPCKGDFTTFTSWCNKQMKDYGVNVLLNTKASVEMIKAGNYDEIVVATGGTPWIPGFIKGVDLPHVKIAEEVLTGRTDIGDNVVIAGGGEVGCETAAHLASIQKGATVVEMKPVLMEELDGVSKENLFQIMNRFHVCSYTSTKVLEIKEDSVLVETPEGQKELPCDSVVLAMGYKPNDQLAKDLEAAGLSVHVIAGAVKTSNALIAPVFIPVSILNSVFVSLSLDKRHTIS
ncbi:MAG: FAD-dependent oxidoreductase [Eubacteriales bacterium]|nr:FAD-dependent oxidoreductase [Eubacteriales bacterium]